MIIEKLKEVPLVSVWMVTYNHVEFIRKSLDSIISQKTNFSYEIVIGDDCSTDGTQSIIKEFEEKYPGIFKPVYHQKNVGAYNNAYQYCYPLLKGKYIACLEGDDYWDDENKLQKQVDFLENNQDYTICWTKYKILKEDQTITGIHEELKEPDWASMFANNSLIDVDLNNIFNPYNTLTLTAMFRRDALDYTLLTQLKYPRDNTIYCLCLSKGKGAVLNFYGAVYRTHTGGIYSSLHLFNQRYPSFLNVEEIVKEIPGCDTRNLKFTRNSLLLESFRMAILENNRQMTIELYKKVIRYALLKNKLKATKLLFTSFLKT